jgi:hypothetical protein
MSTKRTPIGRPPQLTSFPPEALAAFRKMQELEGRCRCKPRDWKGEYWKHTECKACQDWWDQHGILHEALRCKPWQWPCVEHPDSVAPYPTGSAAAKSWQPDLEAQALYRALAAACEDPPKAA